MSMHRPRSDEILSYMWRGSMVHEDSAGNRIVVSAEKLMMMIAVKSFWREESTPDLQLRYCRYSFDPAKRTCQALS